MRIYHKILLAALVGAFAFIAQAAEYLVRPITLDHGLSQTSVRCVLRDNKGYLWIGTDFGLNRYDNNKITHYFYDDNKPGTITDHQVEFLVLDSKGDLLVGLGHGLVKYNHESDTFDEITDQGRSIDVCSALLTDSGVLLGGYGKLYIYEHGTLSVKPLPTNGGSVSAYVNINKAWTAGCYILQTRWDGLWVYNSGSSTIKRLDFYTDKNISSFHIDSTGNMWVSSFGQGLRCYDHFGRLLTKLDTDNSNISSDIVLTITEFEDNIWIGTEQGLDIVNPRDFSVTDLEKRINAPKSCTILCLQADTNGTIYAGTLRHGVLCIYDVPMRTFTNLSADATVFGFTVTSLIPDADTHNIWVGLDGEGVALFDPINETFRHVPGSDDMKVTSLAPYYDKQVLVATYNDGFRILNPTAFTLSHAPAVFDQIGEMSGNKAMAVDLYHLDDGRILAVTDDLFTIGKGDSSPTPVNFTAIRGTAEKLNPFYFDGRTLLVNDKRYLYRYVADSDTCGVVFTTNAGENITAATYDGNNQVWIATNKRLLRYDFGSSTLINFGIDLVHNINSLAIEDNRLWVGADNQLFAIDPDGNLIVFGPNDGMSPNQFINKARLLTDDLLLLGGVNGMLKINRADIQHLLTLPSSAEISISDVMVDNTRASVRDGIVKVPNNHSTVVVSIIDHDNSGVRNKLFRYTVQGFKHDLVIESFDRSITLNMLSPGKYKVLVSYSQSDGKWSESEQVLVIDVEYPWWAQWWAMLIYIAGIAVVGFAVFLNVKAVRRHKLEEMRRSALSDKVDFLTRLHSELRTPLTLILSPLNALIDRAKSQSDTVSAETLETLQDIYSNSINMRDIIEALPETQGLAQFPTDVAVSAKKERDIDVADNNDDDEQSIVDDFDTTPYTVLVVEENEKLSSFIVSHLQSMFKAVEVVKTAKDALFRIKDMHPDIIIADVDLSDENGYEFCRSVKASSTTRHIPVILLTSGNAMGQKRKSYAHGADSYISKPFEIETLISRCKNLLLNRAIMRRRYDMTTPADTMAQKAINNSDESFILQLDQLLADNLSNPKLGVDFLTKQMTLSRTAFYNRMKQLTGRSIGQYIADYRLAQAKKMLTMGSLSMNEIAEALGFSSQRYFSTFFKEKTGMSPTDFRNSQ